jgi:hypothetical protein
VNCVLFFCTSAFANSAARLPWLLSCLAHAVSSLASCSCFLVYVLYMAMRAPLLHRVSKLVQLELTAADDCVVVKHVVSSTVAYCLCWSRVSGFTSQCVMTVTVLVLLLKLVRAAAVLVCTLGLLHLGLMASHASG